MKKFVLDHWVPLALGSFGLFMAYTLSWLWEDQQVGLGPESIIKSFYKLWYVMFVWFVAHVVIRFWFSTIYDFCNPKAGQDRSEFTAQWMSRDPGAKYDPRIHDSILVHLGVMLIVAVIMAFAF